MKKMKKIVLAMAAASVVGFSASAQAASTVCVFDLLGKAGDSYKMMEEWALAAKGWGTEINLVPRQDEAVADNDFKDLSGEALKEAISKRIREKSDNLVGDMASQGTTPRQLTDLIGSLCDLTSGSGDKGTPVVLVQGYFDNYTN